MKTKKLIAGMNIVNRVSLRQQITDQMRAAIISGELTAGTRLPSTTELASMWKATPATVHRALQLLVVEGLITRQVGKGGGTFVSERRKLEQIAVYTCWGVGTPLGNFQSAVLQNLYQVASERGLRLQVIMEGEYEDAEAKPKLMEAVERGEVHGAIYLQARPAFAELADKVNIPMSSMGTGAAQGDVAIGKTGIQDVGLQKLADQGCKSAGLISAYSATDYFDHFRDVVSTLNMSTDDRWIRTRDEHANSQLSQSQYGFEVFKQLFASGPLPNGLIIEPDTVVQGALLAMRECGITRKNQPKLVLSRNASFPYPCPFDATICELSERQLASALIDQLERRYRGERAPRVTLQFGWHEHHPDANIT